MLIIIEAAESIALTTVEAVRLAGVTVGTDQQVEGAIGRASSAISTICGRTLAKERVRQTHFTVPRISAPLVLARWPVVEIHSVEVNGQVVTPGGYSLDGSLLHLDTAGRINVDYSAGYNLPGQDGATLPADIEQVALRLVAQEMHALGRDPNIRSENVDGVSTIAWFSAGATFDPHASLERYRQPVAL